MSTTITRSCSNCKHWRPHSFECDKVDVNYERMPHLQTNTFCLYVDALDDSGLVGKLITGPDFMCNQHELNSALQAQLDILDKITNEDLSCGRSVRGCPELQG